MCALNHPPTSSGSRLSAQLFRFDITWANMANITVLDDDFPAWLSNETCIQAEIFSGTLIVTRAINHHRGKGFIQQLRIMDVCSCCDDGQRDATLVAKDASLASIFFPCPSGLVRRTLAPGAPSPWNHQHFASSSQCLPCRRIRQGLRPIVSQRILPRTTP